MSRERHVVIDGPNVGHAWKAGAANSGAGRQATRRQLSDLAVRLHDEEGWRVSLVFDGRGPELTWVHPPRTEGVTVWETPAGLTGDDLIERLVGKERVPGDCSVVTADRALQSTVLALGAEVVAPADFSAWVERLGERARRRRQARAAATEAAWRAR
jgi:predicted RNA-binding protein with PIN domain